MTTTRTILCTTSTLALSLMSTATYADITAQDVWANMAAPITAMGGTVSGALSQTGEITTVTGVRYDFALPMGAGTFGFVMPDFAMIENGDGSVMIDNPEDSTFTLEAQTNGGSFMATLRMQAGDWNTLATGDPGEITYTGTTDFVEMSLESVEVDGEAMSDISFQFRSEADDATGTTTITEGELVTVTFSSVTSGGQNSFEMRDPFGIETRSEGSTGDTTIDLELALPAEGSSLLNLAPAFAQGLSLGMTFDSEGGETRQTTTSAEGAQLTSQTTTQGKGVGTLQMTAEGVFSETTIENLTLEMMDPMIPVPINIDAAAMSLLYQMPLTASPEDQDYGLGLQLDTLRLGADIWELVDPGKQLDRTPLGINLDMGGTGVLNTDVMDFMAFGAVIDSGETPFMPSTFELRDFSVAALGADANATAAIIFDATDMQTYFGFPKPVGGASFTINGLNAAMDQMSAMGVIGPDEMFGVNMMIGMIANATGDDQLSGTLELGEDGSISANGQRLR